MQVFTTTYLDTTFHQCSRKELKCDNCAKEFQDGLNLCPGCATFHILDIVLQHGRSFFDYLVSLVNVVQKLQFSL